MAAAFWKIPKKVNLFCFSIFKLTFFIASSGLYFLISRSFSIPSHALRESAKACRFSSEAEIHCSTFSLSSGLNVPSNQEGINSSILLLFIYCFFFCAFLRFVLVRRTGREIHILNGREKSIFFKKIMLSILRAPLIFKLRITTWAFEIKKRQ